MIKEKKVHDKATLSVNIYTAIVVILLSPPLCNLNAVKVAMVALMVLWFAINLMNNKFNLPLITVFVLIYIILSVLKYNVDTNMLINPRITRIYYYCFFIVSFPFIAKTGIEKYEKVIWRMMILLPVWLVISIYHGLTVEDLFRGMSGSGIIDNAYYSRLGVVGYDYIYGIVICIPAFLGLLFCVKKLSIFKYVLLIINLVLNIVLLWIANYGLAFFAMITGAVLFFVLGISNRSWRAFFSVIIVAVTIVLIFNMQSVIKWLMDMLSGTYYSGKLKDVYQSVSEGTTYGRVDIWSNAIDKFLENPLWGKGFMLGDVNTHSEILYSLVYYGLIVGGAEIAVLFSVFYKCDFRSALAYRVNIATIVVFFMVLFFDPAGVAFGPLMYTLFKLSQPYFADASAVTEMKEGEVAK